MNVFGKGAHDKISSMESEQIVLDMKIAELMLAIDIGNKKRDELSKPGIAEFMKRWSKIETDRLASKAMTVDISDRDTTLLIRGQYAGALAFGAELEFIIDTINENTTLLEAARNEMARLNTEIAKLRSKNEK